VTGQLPIGVFEPPSKVRAGLPAAVVAALDSLLIDLLRWRPDAEAALACLQAIEELAFSAAATVPSTRSSSAIRREGHPDHHQRDAGAVGGEDEVFAGRLVNIRLWPLDLSCTLRV